MGIELGPLKCLYLWGHVGALMETHAFQSEESSCLCMPREVVGHKRGLDLLLGFEPWLKCKWKTVKPHMHEGEGNMNEAQWKEGEDLESQNTLLDALK